MLAIGSLTSDLFLKPQQQEILVKDGKEYLGFCLGDKVRIETGQETFGGGGANLAVGLARFGIKSAVLGKTGNDSVTERILLNLKKEQVNADHVQQDKKLHSGFSVILSADSGERTVLFSPGANDEFKDFDDNILDGFDGVCLQHLSGNSRQVFDKIAAHFIKNPEKFLSWNPGRESLEKGIEAFRYLLHTVDIMLVNREEAELFTGKKQLSEIFKSFFDTGCGGRVIITDGRKGSVGCDGKKLYHCAAYLDSPRVDTLGAGDSFMTGVVGATLFGNDLPAAMKIGTINAASVVAHYGAQIGLCPKKYLEEKASLIQVNTKPFSF